MKKLIDVTLPVTGSVTVTVSAETDDEALELAFAQAKFDSVQDYDGNGPILDIGVDGNYASLNDVGTDDPNGREVQIGE